MGLEGQVRRPHRPAAEEDGRLLRVEVLRLALPDHAAPEGDACALRVVYGEHDAVVEPVAQLACGVGRCHVGLDHLLGREPLAAQVPHQLPMAGREPELPALRHVAAEPAAAQVLARPLGLGAAAAHELHVVEGGCLLAHLAQALLLRRRDHRAALGVGQVDVRAVGQVAHGLGEREVLGHHDVLEQVAALAAAEAVPDAAVGVDLAGRRLLLVERAAAPELAAARLHQRALAEQRRQVGGVADALDVCVFVEAGHEHLAGTGLIERRRRCWRPASAAPPGALHTYI